MATIGMTRHSKTEHYASLVHLFTSVERSVQKQHEIVYLPDNFHALDEPERFKIAREFVTRCDLVIGSPGVAGIGEARRALRASTPLIRFTLGEMPRGAHGLRLEHKFLSRSDVLVCSCRADATIARLLFHNANVVFVPFAVDTELYCPPTALERAVWRRRLGIAPEDRVILYSGRLTVEKNLHGLLKVFRAVTEQVPRATLFLAGEAFNLGFAPFSMKPVDWKVTLSRLAKRLGIDPSRVRFLGDVPTETLIGLYQAADVLANMTLHHDENFGYSQAEALACGTPVVGTRWGGLKDVIPHGIGGWGVDTYLTPLGVKFDWWSAACYISQILRDDSLRAKLSEGARKTACEHYSQEVLQSSLLDLVEKTLGAKSQGGQGSKSAASGSETVSLGGTSSEASIASFAPIRPTDFAWEIWQGSDATCGAQSEKEKQNQYLRLIAPYTSAAPRPTLTEVSSPSEFSAAPFLLLPSPLVWEEDQHLRVHDPMYYWTIQVPEPHREPAAQILEVMARRVAVTTTNLLQECTMDARRIKQTASWMVQVGLLLAIEHGVRPCLEDAPSVLAQPLLQIHTVPRNADVLCWD